MMNLSNRRHFLRQSLAAGAALAVGSSASAIPPFDRSGKPRLKLSLAAYSYRKYLDLGNKAKPPTMTLFDFANLAADMGLDAIEPTGYYFPDPNPEYMAKFKGHCTRLGLDISGSAVGNNFCVADSAKLRTEIDSVKKWTEFASLMGAKSLRIFAGKPGKGDSEEKARPRCIAAIQEVCDHAAKFGVYMALENHGGIVETIDQILAIVRAVEHPWFGVNWDSGNFHSEDPYADLARLAPYAVTCQIKTEIQRKGEKKKEEADLARLLDMLRAVNYRGYVALEYEAEEDPKTAVPRHLARLRTLIGY